MAHVTSGVAGANVRGLRQVLDEQFVVPGVLRGRGGGRDVPARTSTSGIAGAI